MATQVLIFRDDNSFRDDSSQEDWHDFEVLSRGDEPKILIKKTSMQSDSEKRISVDPKSLLSRNENFNMITSRPSKFISCSLPNSASTSPRHNWKNRTTEQVLDLMLVQNAAVSFGRSKSCGEGRACTPSLDFDMLLHKTRQQTHQHQQHHHNHHHQQHHDDDNGLSSSNTKSLSNKSSANNSLFSKTESNKSNTNTFEDGFKCSALCLYLPSFGKGKPVRSSSRKADSSLTTRTTTMTSTHSMARTVSIRDTTVLSARASLEKFDCGSWTSSAMIHEENVDLGGHFFDLPSELIRGGSGGNDQDDPVSAAFVFHKEPSLEKEIKGVLKTSGSKSRRSMESPLHVRFSTSSPVSYPTSPNHSSITPRLIQATEDFSSFLEAQTV